MTRRRLERWRNRVSRLVRGHRLGVWYDPRYRIPVHSFDAQTGFETRRADLVLWTLLEFGVIEERQVRRPRRASYREICRVHDNALLERLATAEGLARVFAVDARDIPVREVMTTMRLAVGGTIDAARAALRGDGPQLNLLGGFHHAEPDKAGGFSMVNDIAVAVAALRSEGWEGSVAILDLDAHPPDGTAACLEHDERVWIGSISGTDWGPLPGVDETVLTGADDRTYLRTLRDLLSRMPDADLVFVVAGGDVLEVDALGGLSLTLEGAAKRDRRVRDRLGSTPAVWVPAGGYGAHAWRVLTGTAVALELRRPLVVPDDYDPMRARYRAVARALTPDDEPWIDAHDLAEAIGLPLQGSKRFLGFYTEEWMEHALERYGVLDHVRRLGYGPFTIDFDDQDGRERLRVYGRAGGIEHMVFETLLERRRIQDRDVLYVHWLTLRHPLARFHQGQPRLPNQEVPGLGLAKEAGELLLRIARRVQLEGVAFTPAAFHVAYVARRDFRFIDPAREGRFEALVRDLADIPLSAATRGIDEGLVDLDGQPYRWEATDMISTVDEEAFGDDDEVAAARDATRFDIHRLREATDALRLSGAPEAQRTPTTRAT